MRSQARLLKARLLTFLAVLAPSNATPLTHNPRDDLSTSVNYREDLGQTFTNFAPNWPTCGNDRTLTDTGIRTTLTVAVRPDCDTVIDNICQAAVIENDSGKYMTWLGHTTGTCEGHILFSKTRLTDPFDYTICVQTFQSITNTCMLLGDPDVPSNYAAVGSQFGVRNVYHIPPGAASETAPRWSASTRWNEYPGYMIGAAGVWGSVRGIDSEDVLNPKVR